jgi:hypothetical protein
MAAIDVTEEASVWSMPGTPAPPLEPDTETRHRLRKALRILLAARRRDDGGGKHGTT